MDQVNNEVDFKHAVETLDDAAQRQLAASFAANVLEYSDDKRIEAGIKVASNPGADESELSASYKTVKAATIESHTRCGSEGDWSAQAAYFVARACEAALMPVSLKKSGRAIQAAASARMACTAHSIDASEGGETGEREAQYKIFNEFLSKRGQT